MALSQSTLSRIGALDIAEAIAEQIGSYVDASLIEFLAVEGNVVRCWYMNSSGKGPSFSIILTRQPDGWSLFLEGLPPGTEQSIELP